MHVLYVCVNKQILKRRNSEEDSAFTSIICQDEIF